MKRILKTIWLVIKVPVCVAATVTLFVVAGSVLITMVSWVGDAVLLMFPTLSPSPFIARVAFGGIALGVVGVLANIISVFAMYVREKWEEAKER